MALEGLHFLNFNISLKHYFLPLFNFCTIVTTNDLLKFCTSLPLLKFFHLPGKPLSSILLSFIAKLKCQILFKDFLTSSTPLLNTDYLFYLSIPTVLFQCIYLRPTELWISSSLYAQGSKQVLNEWMNEWSENRFSSEKYNMTKRRWYLSSRYNFQSLLHWVL